MITRPGEFELIDRFFRPLAEDTEGAFSLGDDGALLKSGKDENLIVVTDLLVEGVHYLSEDPPDLVARKLLRVNLSDLAAMGAEPRVYTLAMALGGDWTAEWLTGFATGLVKDQDIFRIKLVGGDTVSAGERTILSLTAIGAVKGDAILRRNGAKAGDAVWVSGNIGDAGLGLAVIRGELDGLSAAHRNALIERYRLPEPRVDLGRRLLRTASAAIDVSDGLIADLGHICEQSGTGAVVNLETVPLSEAAAASEKDDAEVRIRAVTAGDDYELLFTAPEASADLLGAVSKDMGLKLTRIGSVTGGDAVTFVDASGSAVEIGETGFQHFNQ